MKKLKLLTMVFTAFILFLGSCEKEPIDDKRQGDNMIVNDDLTLLRQRVNIAGDDNVMPIYPVTTSDKTKSLKSGGVSSNYILKLRAEVSAPEYLGNNLQASHIKIVGDYAYVTYNFQGPEYLGGLDIFDVSDISNPQLIKNVIFPSKDISSVDVESQGEGQNNFVYLTGAQDLGGDTLDLDSPAVIERYILNSANEFDHADDPRQFYDLPSFAGNDVRYHDGKVYATSGSSGGLSIMSTGFGLQEFIDIQKARSVDINDNRMVVFSADGGKLHVFGDDGDFVVETGGAGYPEAKSMVRIIDNFAFVALNEEGMKMYDLTDGSEIDYLPPPDEYQTADMPQNYVTNGVSVDGGLVLVANGGSGVYIAQLDENNKLVTIGSMMFEYGSSANFVEARDNKVFVATGKGGLKIIEIVHYDPGTGDIPVDDVNPEPTVPCETLYGKIKDMFPEGKDIRNGPHADLIGELPGTLRLTEKAPVYISYVHNGAGWDNSFGYYTYDADNPPESAGDLELNIIFPDAKNHNGKKLQSGDRVRLGGSTVEFNANTVIGFFVVAKGWDPGKMEMVEGIHRIFSDKQFNLEGVQKHVLFLEQTCGDIVIGFEDMLGGSDEDFNDMIFVVSNGEDEWGTQVNYAFDTEGLPGK
ncbi:MAG: DUF4114 domain-containing protein [Bacteroidales bacterium]